MSKANPHSCGSCWAFATSEVMSDRFCLASKGKVDVILSPQVCNNSNYTIKNNHFQLFIQLIVFYLITFRLLSLATRVLTKAATAVSPTLLSTTLSSADSPLRAASPTFPVTATSLLALTRKPTPSCHYHTPYISICLLLEGYPYQHSCAAHNETLHYYRAKAFSVHTFNNEKALMTALMNDGPVVGAFTVYEDFIVSPLPLFGCFFRQFEFTALELQEWYLHPHLRKPARWSCRRNGM